MSFEVQIKCSIYISYIVDQKFDVVKITWNKTENVKVIS